MVGLSLKEISSSQHRNVQNGKLNKHKSAQQIVNKEEYIFLHNNNLLKIHNYNNPNY
jgi:hypothetical protein